MLGMWLHEMESLEAISQDDEAKRIFLRMAALSRDGQMGSFLTELARDEDLDDETKGTIGEAAEKMTSHGVGAVVVSDFGRMIGIFTERDLMRAVAGRVHSSEARVREWMTPDPVTMTEDASVEEAGETMIERGFRHIPVVAGERAVGIVSIRDVAEWRLKER